MLSLTSDLHHECREVLMGCREFQSHQMLRAVFSVKPLLPFRVGLPEATDVRARVDLCMDYLLEQNLEGGHPVLPVFLKELSIRYQQGDALHEKLEALYYTVQATVSPRSAPRDAHSVFELILKLDFDEQLELARQALAIRRVAAFLVHGNPECGHGQQVLANRLIRLCRGWQTSQPISIHLASVGVGKSSRVIWKQVARALKLPDRTPPLEIARVVCERWQTQDVILIFHEVDYMAPSLLSGLIKSFWQPLVEMAYDRLYLIQDETYLLMLLIDYSGCVYNWSVVMAEQVDQPEYPRVPLCLPPIGRFTPLELRSWINMAAEVLPHEITTQALLKSADNGIPQPVYEEICRRCGLDWEGDLTKWLI